MTQAELEQLRELLEKFLVNERAGENLVQSIQHVIDVLDCIPPRP